jgi:hypothetical protein
MAIQDLRVEDRKAQAFLLEREMPTMARRNTTQNEDTERPRAL